MVAKADADKIGAQLTCLGLDGLGGDRFLEYGDHAALGPP